MVICQYVFKKPHGIDNKRRKGIDLPPLFVPLFKLEFVQYSLVRTITKKDQSVKSFSFRSRWAITKTAMRSYCIIFLWPPFNNNQSIALLRLIQPLHPTKTVINEFQQKFSFMAAMRKMPDMTRNKMTICSCH